MKTKLLTLLWFLISTFSYAQTSFAALQNIDPNTGDRPWKIASGDIDGDNIVDLAMATYSSGVTDYIKWYKNDGDGNFSETATSVVSSTILAVDGLTIADIDGLHGDDIIATSVSQNKLVYFLSDGAGGHSPEVQVGGTILGAGQVVAGDINKDGDVDLALVAWGNTVGDEKVSWFSGDGTGSFSSETDIASGGTDGSGPFTIDIKDFDGDTDLDILVGYFFGGVEIYYNQYIESGTMTVSWIKDTVTVDSGFSYLIQTLFADVNNDGVMDVVVVDNSTGDVEWFSKIKNGASTPHTISNSSTVLRPGAIAVADVDNDNIDDVILTEADEVNGSSSDIIWFKGANNASPSSSLSSVGTESRRVYSITVEDFDYDGDNDIAFANYQDDRVEWYENEWDLLSVSDNEITSIRIYPNPAKDVLYFKGILNENLEISIYNVIGTEIISTSLNSNNSIDVSNFQSGMYFVKFKGVSETHKFIKN